MPAPTSPASARTAPIGLVFQDAALFPHLTVTDNVRFGPRAAARPPRTAPATCCNSSASPTSRPVTAITQRRERQRVALARALAIQPGLLLLDEPLSALDQPTREDMRALLQRLLAELEIPAAHITHDRDEALTIGDDLAVIVGGQLRQTGPAATVAAEPADPDIARLLGWSELGHGTAADGTARIGQLALDDAAQGLHGPVQAFYRPEDVQLSPAAPDAPADDGLTAHVGRIVHTRPLARVTLRGDPPIVALMLHRDIDRLRLTAGDPVQVSLPPDSLRIFQTSPDP